MKIIFLLGGLILFLIIGCNNSTDPSDQPTGKGVYVNLQSYWEDKWYSDNLSGGRFNWTLIDPGTNKPILDFDIDYERPIEIESISFEMERSDINSSEPYRINWGLDSLFYWVSIDTVACESVGSDNTTSVTYWYFDFVNEGENLIISKLDWSVWMQHPIHLYVNVFAYIYEKKD
jgi:hypothetical protein